MWGLFECDACRMRSDTVLATLLWDSTSWLYYSIVGEKSKEEVYFWPLRISDVGKIFGEGGCPWVTFFLRAYAVWLAAVSSWCWAFPTVTVILLHLWGKIRLSSLQLLLLRYLYLSSEIASCLIVACDEIVLFSIYTLHWPQTIPLYTPAWPISTCFLCGDHS